MHVSLLGKMPRFILWSYIQVTTKVIIVKTNKFVWSYKDFKVRAQSAINYSIFLFCFWNSRLGKLVKQSYWTKSKRLLNDLKMGLLKRCTWIARKLFLNSDKVIWKKLTLFTYWNRNSFLPACPRQKANFRYPQLWYFSSSNFFLENLSVRQN